MRSARVAAMLLALAGLMVVYGSFATWDTCPKFPCEGSFGFFSLLNRSGVDLGIGMITAELGLLLSIAGIAAFRRGGTSPFRTELMIAAGFTLAIVAIYLGRTFVFPEFLTYGPNLGVYVVAVGATMALLASSRLSPPDPSTRRWAKARRLPIALILAGVGVWALALGWHLGPDRLPLAFALFLIAVGVALWPATLPFTRLKPPTVGVLIAGYGAASLAAIVIGVADPWLLQAGPIVVLIGVLVIGVLEPPLEQPHPSTDQAS
jgi:hypothetical protein